MASSYTYALINGDEISFESFFIKCAGAFGVATDQLKETSDGIEFIPKKHSEYYYKEIEDATRNMVDFEKLTPDDVVEIERLYEIRRAEKIIEKIEENKLVLNRLKTYLKKAQDFIPPTPDHENFKDFLIVELLKAIEDMEIDDFYVKTLGHIKKRIEGGFNGVELKTLTLQAKRGDISRMEKRLAREIKETQTNNDWVVKLIENYNTIK